MLRWTVSKIPAKERIFQMVKEILYFSLPDIKVKAQAPESMINFLHKIIL